MNSNQTSKKSRRRKGTRDVDQPIVAIHIYMMVVVSFAIIASTIGVTQSPDWPNHLTFYESFELRILCYSWCMMALLLTSFTSKAGWLVPMAILGMWAGFIVMPYLFAFDSNGWRIFVRIGIFLGLLLGLLLNFDSKRFGGK